eukprot:CAMPEP_0182885618 /NCGR_PEP_ID=MMETSP0034_2-20130328/19715_1 /TAXON_ID=156128 /ORGANISM="Nephroselmis pyriformis, Strain CCMP717" /LENGTH=1355 /DNA_ID=CAMNT_0025018891 /DNA_START=107 /DNA_END=4171 /DNA_ORIENTATION=+
MRGDKHSYKDVNSVKAQVWQVCSLVPDRIDITEPDEEYEELTPEDHVRRMVHFLHDKIMVDAPDSPSEKDLHWEGAHGLWELAVLPKHHEAYSEDIIRSLLHCATSKYPGVRSCAAGALWCLVTTKNIRHMIIHVNGVEDLLAGIRLTHAQSAAIPRAGGAVEPTELQLQEAGVLDMVIGFFLGVLALLVEEKEGRSRMRQPGPPLAACLLSEARKVSGKAWGLNETEAAGPMGWSVLVDLASAAGGTMTAVGSMHVMQKLEGDRSMRLMAAQCLCSGLAKDVPARRAMAAPYSQIPEDVPRSPLSDMLGLLKSGDVKVQRCAVGVLSLYALDAMGLGMLQECTCLVPLCEALVELALSVARKLPTAYSIAQTPSAALASLQKTPLGRQRSLSKQTSFRRSSNSGDTEVQEIASPQSPVLSAAEQKSYKEAVKERKRLVEIANTTADVMAAAACAWWGATAAVVRVGAPLSDAYVTSCVALVEAMVALEPEEILKCPNSSSVALTAVGYMSQNWEHAEALMRCGILGALAKVAHHYEPKVRESAVGIIGQLAIHSTGGGSIVKMSGPHRDLLVEADMEAYVLDAVLSAPSGSSKLVEAAAACLMLLATVPGRREESVLQGTIAMLRTKNARTASYLACGLWCLGKAEDNRKCIGENGGVESLRSIGFREINDATIIDPTSNDIVKMEWVISALWILVLDKDNLARFCPELSQPPPGPQTDDGRRESEDVMSTMGGKGGLPSGERPNPLPLSATKSREFGGIGRAPSFASVSEDEPSPSGEPVAVMKKLPSLSIRMKSGFLTVKTVFDIMSSDSGVGLRAEDEADEEIVAGRGRLSRRPSGSGGIGSSKSLGGRGLKRQISASHSSALERVQVWIEQYGAVGMVAAIVAQKRRGVAALRDRLKTICTYFLHNLSLWNGAFEEALMGMDLHTVLVTICGDTNHKELLRVSAAGLFLELATKRDVRGGLLTLFMSAMMTMCRSGLEALEEPGVRGIAWLAVGAQSKVELLRLGAVEQLVTLAKRRPDNECIREFVLRGLLNLSTNPRCQVRIAHRALELLVQTSTSERWPGTCQRLSSCVLSNISRNPNSRTLLYRAELRVKSGNERERARTARDMSLSGGASSWGLGQTHSMVPWGSGPVGGGGGGPRDLEVKVKFPSGALEGLEGEQNDDAAAAGGGGSEVGGSDERAGTAGISHSRRLSDLGAVSSRQRLRDDVVEAPKVDQAEEMRRRREHTLREVVDYRVAVKSRFDKWFDQEVASDATPVNPDAGMPKQLDDYGRARRKAPRWVGRLSGIPDANPPKRKKKGKKPGRFVLPTIPSASGVLPNAPGPITGSTRAVIRTQPSVYSMSGNTYSES